MSYKIPQRPVTSVEFYLNGLLEEIKGLRADMQKYRDGALERNIEIRGPDVTDLTDPDRNETDSKPKGPEDSEGEEVKSVQEPGALRQQPGQGKRHKRH